MGNYQQAKINLEKSLEIHKLIFSNNPNSPKLTRVLLNLGNTYAGLGEYEKSKELFEQSHASYEKFYGTEHIETARHMRAGDPDTAEKHMKKSLEIFQQNNHSESFSALEGLAELYNRKSMQELEKSYLEQALEAIKVHFRSDSPHIMRVKSKLN